MAQPRGLLTPEERARITELQDRLIACFVEHREATSQGEEDRVRELEAELAQAGANVATEEMAADIANELKSGHAVAYTAVTAGGDVFVAKATDAPAPAEAEKAPEAAPAPNTPST